MKQHSKLLLSLLHGVGIGAVAVAGNALISTEATAQVRDTRHNLGAGGGATNNKVSAADTAEVCVFCHTPHAAASTTDTNLTLPPLWNKNLPAATGFTTYAEGGSSTLDATSGGSASVGSTSLACLSCHDGTQALDNILNAPGSDQVDATGGGANGRAWTWSGVGVNGAGVITRTATNIGKDLQNDHPIGIAYCGGLSAGGSWSANTAANIGCRDQDFNALSTSGTNQYYVDTGANGASGAVSGSKDKTDMILYWRTDGTSTVGAGFPSVECGSCHDPHVQTKAANQVAFLRVSQANSALCLACHNK